tara:strand:- start:5862 stop:6263 length:402 start_codon:yes stop_codon:yes gene_type:complete
MTIRHFKKSMALLLGGLAVSLHAVGESHCSDQNASIIENAMESRLEAESRTIVWMRNNKQFELDSCLASGDGHQGLGTLSFTGSDGAAYWVKGRVKLNPNGKIISNEFIDASNSFKTLAIMKAGAMAAASGGS